MAERHPYFQINFVFAAHDAPLGSEEKRLQGFRPEAAAPMQPSKSSRIRLNAPL